MPKDEFLMLAHDFDREKHSPANMYMSEKLDGVRAFWDGGVSRGFSCKEIPWANIEKHHRYLVAPTSTGLWTRYAQPIAAPEWFLNHLPKIPMDGELTCGRGNFQQTLSCIRKLEANASDAEWEDIRYAVFDSPPLNNVLGDRDISIPQMKLKIRGALAWIKERGYNFDKYTLFDEIAFWKVYRNLEDLFSTIKDEPCYLLKQEQLSLYTSQSTKRLNEELDRISDLGGEGLMLRTDASFWQPVRSWRLLKVKKLNDSEGEVIGYTWAEPTDLKKSITGEKTDKLLGLMGSIKVRMENGVTLDISGFTNEERRIRLKERTDDRSYDDAKLIGMDNPGEPIDVAKFVNPTFPIGSVVTFKHRGLSDDGVPKEARYFRPA